MSIFNYRHDIPSQLVTNQPQEILDLESRKSTSNEKNPSSFPANNHYERICHCERGGQTLSSGHTDIGSRRLLLPAVLALLALGGLLAWSCVNWHVWSNSEGPGFDNLVR